MDWYRGPTLLQFLESAPVAVRVAGGLRFPVQYVIRSGEQRAYAGQLAGGTVRPGDDVVVFPGGLETRVAARGGRPAGRSSRRPRRCRSRSRSRASWTSAAAR